MLQGSKNWIKILENVLFMSTKHISCDPLSKAAPTHSSNKFPICSRHLAWNTTTLAMQSHNSHNDACHVVQTWCCTVRGDGCMTIHILHSSFSKWIISTKESTTALTTTKLHDFKKRNNTVVGDYRFSYTWVFTLWLAALWQRTFVDQHQCCGWSCFLLIQGQSDGL